MESPEFAHLYTLAALAMTFVGFSVIVMVLRQSLGHKFLASTCLHGVWVDDIRRLIGTAVAHALGERRRSARRYDKAAKVEFSVSDPISNSR